MLNAFIIEENDDVAVAIEPVTKGDIVTYQKKSGETCQLIALDDIIIYHKIAVKDISKGAKVVKYGEHIGTATQDIAKGAYVHTHNVEGERENLRI